MPQPNMGARPAVGVAGLLASDLAQYRGEAVTPPELPASMRREWARADKANTGRGPVMASSAPLEGVHALLQVRDHDSATIIHPHAQSPINPTSWSSHTKSWRLPCVEYHPSQRWVGASARTLVELCTVANLLLFLHFPGFDKDADVMGAQPREIFNLEPLDDVVRTLADGKHPLV